MLGKSFYYTLVASKVTSVLATLLVGVELKLDAGVATVIVALFVAITSMWQSWMLNKVHAVVNSNFTEAKLGRAAAEAALKTSQDFNAVLQKQLDNKDVVNLKAILDLKKPGV